MLRRQASAARDVLFFLCSISLSDIMDLGEDNLRNTLVDRAAASCTDDLKRIQGLNTTEVAGLVMAQKVLVRGGIASETEIKGWGIDKQRNSLVSSNQRYTGLPASTLQSESTFDNAMRAYSTWLYQVEALPLLSAFSNIGAAETSSFSTKALLPETNRTVGVDCISIIERTKAKGYLGVFHTADTTQEDVFDLYVATSDDLKTWEAANTPLIKRASMAKLYGGADLPFSGILLLYEANVEGKGPSVAGAWFATEDDLLEGKISQQFLTSRTLSGNAEGTPNLIRATTMDAKSSDTSPQNCVLTIGMHYFDKRESGEMIDQQAYAVIKGFDSAQWRAAPCSISNAYLPKQGYLGKLGARSSFMYNGRLFYVMEVQKELDNWSSWRLLLGDGVGFTELSVRTPSLSSSFANPSVAALSANEIGSNERSFIVTSFVPSEGSWGNEEGELVYRVEV